MEQNVRGSQNEHFFELLHPTATRGSPPPPPPPPPASTHVDTAEDGSSLDDTSPAHAITPSYDFHLTHSAKPAETSSNVEDLPRASALTPSAEHVQGSSVDTSRRLVYEKPTDATDATGHMTMEAIECTIKQYTDNVVDALDSINGRLSYLETTVQGLEHTIAGLKFSEGEKQDQSNGRLMSLETLLAEVHRGVQLLQEKQRLDEAQAALMAKANLDGQKSPGGALPQIPVEGWQQPKTAKEEISQVPYSESVPQLPHHMPSQYAPPPQAHYHPAPPPPQMQAFTTAQAMVPSPSTMSGIPVSNQQPYPPPVQHILPPQPSAQATQTPSHNPLPNPAHYSQPTPQLPPPQSSYNVPMETTAYSHMQPQHLPPPPAPPSSTYLPEPSHYTGGMHGGPRQPSLPQELLHPPQQHHNPVGVQHTYEPNPASMAHAGMAPSYFQPPLPKPAPSVYETAGGGGGYGSTPYRTAQPVPSAPSGGGGGGGYPRLPTAQPIQRGSPAANLASSGPSTRQVDDVVERVVNMGFHRDQVRGVVRQLSESGQSVEYNALLDKLMNGGDAPQPARGWFNRG